MAESQELLEPLSEEDRKLAEEYLEELKKDLESSRDREKRYGIFTPTIKTE